MRNWIPVAGLVLALSAAAALPAAAKSSSSDRIVTQQAPWGQVRECRAGQPSSGNDWFCVIRPAQPGWGWQNGWQNGSQYGQGWRLPAWTQPRWNQQQAWNGWARVLPEQTIRQQVWRSGLHDIERVRYDDDDNVYRVRASDRKGRDYKLVYDAVSGRLLNKERID